MRLLFESESVAGRYSNPSPICEERESAEKEAPLTICVPDVLPQSDERKLPLTMTLKRTKQQRTCVQMADFWCRKSATAQQAAKMNRMGVKVKKRAQNCILASSVFAKEGKMEKMVRHGKNSVASSAVKQPKPRQPRQRCTRGRCLRSSLLRENKTKPHKIIDKMNRPPGK